MIHLHGIGTVQIIPSDQKPHGMVPILSESPASKDPISGSFETGLGTNSYQHHAPIEFVPKSVAPTNVASSHLKGWLVVGDEIGDESCKVLRQQFKPTTITTIKRHRNNKAVTTTSSILLPLLPFMDVPLTPNHWLQRRWNEVVIIYPRSLVLIQLMVKPS